jgi:hypothetical protein
VSIVPASVFRFGIGRGFLVPWYQDVDRWRPSICCLHTSAWLVCSTENARIAQILGSLSLSLLGLIANLQRVDATRATFVGFGVLENSRASDAPNPHDNVSIQHPNRISTL